MGILIAQNSLLMVLRSLRTLHCTHNLGFLLQDVALPLEGTCGSLEGLVHQG